MLEGRIVYTIRKGRTVYIMLEGRTVYAILDVRMLEGRKTEIIQNTHVQHMAHNAKNDIITQPSPGDPRRLRSACIFVKPDQSLRNPFEVLPFFNSIQLLRTMCNKQLLAFWWKVQNNHHVHVEQRRAKVT